MTSLAYETANRPALALRNMNERCWTLIDSTGRTAHPKRPRHVGPGSLGIISFLGVHMGKKLYVGNLDYGVSSSDLEAMFAAHGTVQSAQVIVDRDTGRSKGFGFVEMGTDQEAQAAIQALNGQQSGGRALTVNEA